MKKENVVWKIEKLQSVYKNIEFPEFQREPTVWALEKKQLLIDSIFRGLDISTIYLVKSKTESKNGQEQESGTTDKLHSGSGKSDSSLPDSRNEDSAFRFDCIDGRQRINAILSFLGLNEADDPSGSLHNKFSFKSTNELHPKEILEELDGRTFDELQSDEKSNWDQLFLNYAFNVLEITEIPLDKSDELNLMFLRLQGGSGLNPGEKLRAMKGRMHDLIFGTETVTPDKPPHKSTDDGSKKEEQPEKEDPIGKHPFFAYLSIPNRRYAREQVAVQIAMNFFSLEKQKEFKRARFVDLQEFLGDYVTLSAEDEEIAKKLRTNLDVVFAELSKAAGLRIKNRAQGVSVFFFINGLINSENASAIPDFLRFLEIFLPKLREQVEKGIEIDDEYRDLLKFQTYVSQAAVEKYAIENRQRFLSEYFDYFLKHGEIKRTKVPKSEQR